VILDGLFSEQPDGAARFAEATHLTSDDAHHLHGLLQCRIHGTDRSGRPLPLGPPPRREGPVALCNSVI